MSDQEQNLREFGAIISALLRGEDIDRETAKNCWLQICEEAQPDLQQGAFMAALSAKGETPAEIAGTFEALYEADTTKVKLDIDQPIIDNCGTGADTLKTFNISTAAAIVAASQDVIVVRHAARAISSNCGAIDVIEALGVNVETDIDIPKQSIEKAGIGAWNAFLPQVHPKTLGRVLSQVRFGSTINIVGPLLNPTMPEYKVMGVPSIDMIDIEAKTLRELGIKRGFLMYGLDNNSDKGMDELSTLGTSKFAELNADGSITHGEMTPADFGMSYAQYHDVASSRDIQKDATALVRVLMGVDQGAKEDIVCLNSAPLLYLMSKVSTLEDGVAMARKAIRNGDALSKLQDWVRWQNANQDDGLNTLQGIIAKAH